MLVHDPIARRVARRHAREGAILFRDAPAKNTRVYYSNSGRISSVELMKMLEPSTGKLLKLQFRRSLKIDPNGVEWESLDENANIVSGKLELHAAVADDEIVSWAEVRVDEDRYARVARRVAVRYMRRTEGLVRLDDEEDDDERAGDEGEQLR